MPINWNCDHAGNGMCSSAPVRILPTGAGGNIICCHRHWQVEIDFRKERNKKLCADAQYDLPEWESLKVYDAQ